MRNFPRGALLTSNSRRLLYAAALEESLEKMIIYCNTPVNHIFEYLQTQCTRTIRRPA
jgi:hypothetical protein